MTSVLDSHAFGPKSKAHAKSVFQELTGDNNPTIRTVLTRWKTPGELVSEAKEKLTGRTVRSPGAVFAKLVRRVHQANESDTEAHAFIAKHYTGDDVKMGVRSFARNRAKITMGAVGGKRKRVQTQGELDDIAVGGGAGGSLRHKKKKKGNKQKGFIHPKHKGRHKDGIKSGPYEGLDDRVDWKKVNDASALGSSNRDKYIKAKAEMVRQLGNDIASRIGIHVSEAASLGLRSRGKPRGPFFSRIPGKLEPSEELLIETGGTIKSGVYAGLDSRIDWDKIAEAKRAAGDSKIAQWAAAAAEVADQLIKDSGKSFGDAEIKTIISTKAAQQLGLDLAARPPTQPTPAPVAPTPSPTPAPVAPTPSPPIDTGIVGNLPFPDPLADGPIVDHSEDLTNPTHHDPDRPDHTIPGGHDMDASHDAATNAIEQEDEIDKGEKSHAAADHLNDVDGETTNFIEEGDGQPGHKGKRRRGGRHAGKGGRRHRGIDPGFLGPPGEGKEEKEGKAGDDDDVSMPPLPIRGTGSDEKGGDEKGSDEKGGSGNAFREEPFVVPAQRQGAIKRDARSNLTHPQTDPKPDEQLEDNHFASMLPVINEDALTRPVGSVQKHKEQFVLFDFHERDNEFASLGDQLDDDFYKQRLREDAIRFLEPLNSMPLEFKGSNLGLSEGDEMLSGYGMQPRKPSFEFFNHEMFRASKEGQAQIQRDARPAWLRAHQDNNNKFNQIAEGDYFPLPLSGIMHDQMRENINFEKSDFTTITPVAPIDQITTFTQSIRNPVDPFIHKNRLRNKDNLRELGYFPWKI